MPPTCPLRPVNPNNARALRITAAAGTELAGAYSLGTVIIFPKKRALRPEGLLHSCGIAASGLRPLRKIPQAASRRSLDRVSVPVWRIILSDPLTIVALVSHYPTNKLMVRRPIPQQ